MLKKTDNRLEDILNTLFFIVFVILICVLLLEGFMGVLK